MTGHVFLLAAALLVVGVLVWQGVTAAGAPDPAKPNVSRVTALLDVGVLVFREGLECILVLAAVTASMTGRQAVQRRPVFAGAGIGGAATLATWFVAVGIVHRLGESVPALQLQAATGLLAVLVLLVIMNWFFHKVYWGGWICLHNRKKKALLQAGGPGQERRAQVLWGLGLLGFTALYREGFEIVLFLQSYRLQMGDQVVLGGTLVGLALTGAAAALTFVAHRRLPYRRMLVLTGVLLGGVLLVMVGEQAQEMQLAGWLPTTRLPWLAPYTPDWLGVWFAVFPTGETLAAQLLAALLVVGSYFAAGRVRGPERPGGAAARPGPARSAVDEVSPGAQTGAPAGAGAP